MERVRVRSVVDQWMLVGPEPDRIRDGVRSGRVPRSNYRVMGTSHSPARGHRRAVEADRRHGLGDRVAVGSGEGDLLADDRTAERQPVRGAAVGQQGADLIELVDDAERRRLRDHLRRIDRLAGVLVLQLGHEQLQEGVAVERRVVLVAAAVVPGSRLVVLGVGFTLVLDDGHDGSGVRCEGRDRR